VPALAAALALLVPIRPIYGLTVLPIALAAAVIGARTPLAIIAVGVVVFNAREQG